MVMERVFVYGTLKREQPNFDLMAGGEWDQGGGQSPCCRFVGTFRTVEPYPLVVAGRYNIPFLLDRPGLGQRVEGEVFEVNGPALKRMDKLEGVPDFYKRIKIKLAPLTSKQDEQPHSTDLNECWVYMLRSYKPELLDLHMLASFDTRQAKNYIPPCERPEGDGNIHWSEVLATVMGKEN